MRWSRLVYWGLVVGFVIASGIYNMIGYGQYHRGCTEYNCTYVYAGSDGPDSCYTVSIPTNVSLCIQCYPESPLNYSACYSPTGGPLEIIDNYPSFDCPSRLACFNRTAYVTLLSIDVFFGFLAFVLFFLAGYQLYLSRDAEEVLLE